MIERLAPAVIHDVERPEEVVDPPDIVSTRGHVARHRIDIYDCPRVIPELDSPRRQWLTAILDGRAVLDAQDGARGRVTTSISTPTPGVTRRHSSEVRAANPRLMSGRSQPQDGALAPLWDRVRFFRFGVAGYTPKKGEDLFERMGKMTPSKSTLDRLPKIFAEDRKAFERALRDGLEIPEGTASIAVSLDGVLAPINGANSPHGAARERRERRATEQGAGGLREASCATVSFCDAKGDLLGAVRMARAPEAKKATLKQMPVDEVAAILLARPGPS